MKVRVQIIETKKIVRTYEVDGVNSLEAAAKCAERCARRQFQPNTYMRQEVPYAPTIGSYEVVSQSQPWLTRRRAARNM